MFSGNKKQSALSSQQSAKTRTQPRAAALQEKIGDRNRSRDGKEAAVRGYLRRTVRQEMLASGDAEDIVAAHLSIYQAIQQGRLAPVTDNVERVLGRKAITFDQWLQENLAMFAPGNKPSLLSV